MKWLTKGMTAMAALCMVTACNDTWDEHYDANVPSGATKTLWEQISERPELSDFKEVLENTRYYMSASKVSNYTYKELLSSTQTFTVWAPVNGTFDKDALLNRIQDNEEYQVGQEFIRNHISYYRRNIYGDAVDTLTFLSKKIGVMENAQQAITIMSDDIAIEEKNVAAVNGILQVIEKPLPYQSNLYEYLYSDSRFTTMKSLFEKYDTAYLNEFMSTIGPPVNGKVTYADSVMIEENRLFNYSFNVDGNYQAGMMARLDAEDSLYAMILPTNEAWNKAVEKIKPYFKYRSSYIRSDGSNPTPYELGSDSMQNIQVFSAIIKFITFNARYQPDPKFTGIESFKSMGLDSIVTTRSSIIKEREEEQDGNLSNYFCNRLFENTTPVRLSNGSAFITNDLLIEPFYTFKPDIEFEAEYYTSYMLSSSGTPTSLTPDESRRLTDEEGNPVVTGTISNRRFLRVFNSSNASVARFKFPQTLSGKYRLYAILLPEGMYTDMTNGNKNTRRPYSITATLKYHNDKEGVSVPTAQQFDELKKTGITSDIMKVDTVDIFEQDIELPISYYGIDESAVELTLEATKSRTNTLNPVLYIDKLILKSVED